MVIWILKFSPSLSLSGAKLMELLALGFIIKNDLVWLKGKFKWSETNCTPLNEFKIDEMFLITKKEKKNPSSVLIASKSGGEG